MTDWKFTGNVKDGKYEYTNGRNTKWLEHGEESITGPTPKAKEFTLSSDEKKSLTKKNQSDYHKRRYQMIRKGNWGGHMPKG